jgi:hypothetical protein
MLPQLTPEDLIGLDRPPAKAAPAIAALRDEPAPADEKSAATAAPMTLGLSKGFEWQTRLTGFRAGAFWETR